MISFRPRILNGATALLLIVFSLQFPFPSVFAATFRAGAARVDITPQKLPVIRNGGFLQAVDRTVEDPIHARALVLEDDNDRLAIVVVDTCMLPRDLCDAVKRTASTETGIPPNRILISATHTHSAPSSMDYCLGTTADPDYAKYLPGKLVEAIVQAAARVEPALAGWTAVDAGEFTNCRRWILRLDKIRADPFGEATVRAHMHPGHRNPDFVGPSGPKDPWLSLLSIQTAAGKPLAVLANFSMHYFGGHSGVSPDYFGRFADGLRTRLAADSDSFVGIMSQGTSGDSWWDDYSTPSRRSWSIDEYTGALLDLAEKACRGLEHRLVPLDMAEHRMRLNRRPPDDARLEWARQLLAEMGDNRPRNQPEVYAEQAVYIHENPSEEIVLQAIRIGDLGITAIPNEVYAITGLKLKARSPFPSTFNIELANGAAGYIPPPEQHALGGYTTWPARTAGLEVQAEPKIVEQSLRLLERVSGKPRKPHTEPLTRYARSVIKSRPIAYWRLGEMEGNQATDLSGFERHATFEGLVAYHLSGPPFAGSAPDQSASVQFAGGRVSLAHPRPRLYAAEFWFYPGLETRAAEETLLDWGGDRLSIDAQGRLTFGAEKTALTPKRWSHLVLLRRGNAFQVYLNGKPALAGEQFVPESAGPVLLLGNSTDSPFQGRLDEIALYDQWLTEGEIASHYGSAGIAPPPRAKPPSTSQTKGSSKADLERYAAAVLASKPLAYWPLTTPGASAAQDMGEHHLQGTFESGAGPREPGALLQNFTGGRLRIPSVELGHSYSLELWFRNETPNTARLVTGYLFSQGPDGARTAPGDHLGIGGTHLSPGRLFLFNGNDLNQELHGPTVIEPGGWNHVVLTRDQEKVRIHLNGSLEPEVNGALKPTYPPGPNPLFIGGRNDNFANFNGAIDQVALYDRPLAAAEIADHFKASGVSTPGQPAPKANTPQPSEAPLSAQESMAKTHVPEGFVLELVAGEPLVRDPVAIDWGPDGKLWVAEMADYPYGMDGRGQSGGRIRYLLDNDGDGRYEQSQLFLDQVNFPTSVLAWKRGVLVAAAPDIFYAEDTDGDGTADRREVLFTGFIQGNQQLRVNSLRWGLDNWVYAASGGHHAGFGTATTIEAPSVGEQYPLGSRDFRVQPDRGLLDPQSGPSQFGRVRDDWGNWFGVQNSFPLWHYVLADHYTRRNPDIAAPDPRKQLRVPGNPQVFTFKSPQKRFHSFEQSGRFTSACGPSIYRDELLFPQEQITHAFTCEPFHNVVQHHEVSPAGFSFTAERASNDGALDFFASADRWCRPVMTRTGPDGALWIVDMYRYMIEHPDWLPPAGRKELLPFYRSGEEYGRIYRICRADRKPRPIPVLAHSSASEIVSALTSPNGTTRDLAQRLLVQQGNRAIAPQLEQVFHANPDPRVRLAALCTLDGLDAVSPELLLSGTKDPHPQVRRHAVRLAENSTNPDLLEAVAALVDDPDPVVRFQLALSLGEWRTKTAARTLATLARRADDDSYLRSAILSSASPHYATLVELLVDDPRYSKALMAMAGTDPQRLAALLANILDNTTASTASPALAQWLDWLDEQNRPLETAMNGELREWQGKLRELIANARATAVNPNASTAERCRAMALLGRETSHREADLHTFASFLKPSSDESLQREARSTLIKRNQPEGLSLLLRGWRAYGPEARQAIVGQLLSRTAGAKALLDHVKDQSIAVIDIGPTHRQQFLKHQDQGIKSLAEALFGAPTETERAQAVERFQSALSLTGNAARGKDHFVQRCAVCHRLDEVGTAIGPDLRSLTDRSPETLLTSILDPSRTVEPVYLGYSATLTTGESIYGLVTSETGNSLVMRQLDGTQRELLRTSIDSLESSRLSFMPTGLEEGLSGQDMADLLAYLGSALRKGSP